MTNDNQSVVRSFDHHVGARLRVARKLRGLSQSALGQLVGLTFQQIQKYEHGLVRISAGRVVQFSSEMDIPIEFFFDGVQVGGEGVSPFSSLLLDLSQLSETKLLCIQLIKLADDEDVLPLIRLLERMVSVDADAPARTANSSK